MSDKQAQAEAWVRKKKKTIYSENFIKFLIILAAALPIPMAAFVLWVVFYFPFMPVIVLVVWGIASAVYVTLDIVGAERSKVKKS
jgi:uncharacterized RDD family membrane protein YckC